MMILTVNCLIVCSVDMFVYILNYGMFRKNVTLESMAYVFSFNLLA